MRRPHLALAPRVLYMAISVLSICYLLVLIKLECSMISISRLPPIRKLFGTRTTIELGYYPSCPWNCWDNLARLYDHELESLAWVFDLVSGCVLNGEDSKRPPNLKEWVDDVYDEVYKSKLAFIMSCRCDIPPNLRLSNINRDLDRFLG